MATLLDTVAVGFLVIGLVLATVGLIGLLRMSDVFHQLHAAGLVTGPAVICILLASVATGEAEIITSAVLMIVFLLITAPLASHAIANAARHRPDAAEPGADEPE